jgi:WD40 repeat protein
MFSLAWSPDGKTLAVVNSQGPCQVFDPVKGDELRRLTVAGQAGGLLSADGKTLAWFSDSQIRLAEVATGKEVLATPEQPLPPFLVFTPDGTGVIGASEDKKVRVWGAATGKERGVFATALQDGGVTGYVFTPDGKAVIAFNRGFQVWELATGKERSRSSWPDWPGATALSPDGKLVAWGEADSRKTRDRGPGRAPKDCTIHLVDLATGKELRKVDGHHKGSVTGLAFAPDGKTLLSTGADGQLGQWDLETGKKVLRYTPPAGHKFPLVALAPDGQTVYLAYEQAEFVRGRPAHDVVAYDPATGKERRRFRTPHATKFVSFSPDRRMIALVNWLTGAVVVWEAATGRERCRFQGHTSEAMSAVFSPDGKALAVAGRDGTVLVYDLLGAGKGLPAKLEEKRLQALWDDLGDDADKAYRALGALVAAPGSAVPWLRDKVKPVVVDDKRLARLIADLESDQFKVRERATEGLRELGERALPALKELLAGKPGLETRRRAEQLVAALERQELSPGQLRLLRALEALERMNTAEARQVLQTLAKGAPGSVLTREARAALQRLARP